MIPTPAPAYQNSKGVAEVNDQSIIATGSVRQVPIVRRDGQAHPTPVEIRTAIFDALIEDARDPNTPYVPVHVNELIRSAIRRANRGEYQ